MKSILLQLLLLSVLMLVAVNAVRVHHMKATIDSGSDVEGDAEVDVESETAVEAEHEVSGGPLDVSGRYTYSNRDGSLLHINALVKCVENCQTLTPKFEATLVWPSVFLANLTFNSGNLVGFGEGPPPAIFSGCKYADITVVQAHNTDSNTILALYAPCASFPGGASIYTRYGDVNGGTSGDPTQSPSLMKDLEAKLKSMMTKKPEALNTPVPSGAFVATDRLNSAVTLPFDLSCTNCGSSGSTTPSYVATNSRGVPLFSMTFTPIQLSAFGTYNVYNGEKLCGTTKFSFVVPPANSGVVGEFLAAVAPLPACDFAGFAFSINKRR